VTIELIKTSKIIFWDFDGVIKDSVSAKSDAFEQLFLPFGNEVAKKVRNHHEENGGISRFDKLPIYLRWAGRKSTNELICEYEQMFSNLVLQKVIESPWVIGVLEYLKKNAKRQKFYIITATPQKEIEIILKNLKIAKYFKKVIGSPTNKKEALKNLLINFNHKEAVMIGDSITDYQAAKENHVKFILRKTELNKKLQKQLKCSMIKNFFNE